MAIGRREDNAMRTLVINCSDPHDNLGAHKLADWLRAQGEKITVSAGDPGLFVYGYDRVCLSVIFSWHAPLARAIALRVRNDADVWCGGPGMFALTHWWQRETGLTCHRGLDSRFEQQRGTYRMTFASRGCPVNCSFCLVPRLEGQSFTLDWEFVPAPILCDNNLSALPLAFQDHILCRYQETGTPLIDANSGFEPQTFDETTYQRWRPTLRGPWRFAFDTLQEEAAVARMMQILRDERPKRKQVYVLIGHEPLAACYHRAQQVIAWGGEPFCQPFIPLNALQRVPKVIHDWTPMRLRDFTRYYNRHLWRTLPLTAYRPRASQSPPFADVLPSVRVVMDMGRAAGAGITLHHNRRNP
jgi:pyruvate-formate lyase-activating enzyme